MITGTATRTQTAKYHPGYIELLEKLEAEYPLGSEIIGEQAEKDFIRLFGTILSMRNILRLLTSL